MNVGVDQSDHLLSPVVRATTEHPDEPLVAHRVKDRFVDLTSAEVWTRTRTIARGLMARGVAPGDRVALMGRSSLEWLLVDLAINAVGAVTVPIYETSSPSQVDWILADSGAVQLVVGDGHLASMAAPVVTASSTCHHDVIVMDDVGLRELEDLGAAIDDDLLDARVSAISAHDTATIIYTSGTTGRPKGCVLSHHNLRANVAQITDALKGTVDSSDTAMLFLPLAHVLTKVTALYCLEHRIKISFATSMDRLAEELALAKPSLISAVPRVFEKVFMQAQHKAESEHKGIIFNRAAELSIRWSREHQAHDVRSRTRLEHGLYERLVYGKIRAGFGGQLRIAFSGGGPLGERLTSFFDGIGLRIYEGYGLTETSPILTLSRSDAWAPGSVGPPVRDTQIRLGADGEILAKGPQVFSGYWGNDDATAEVFDPDGWFRTGDVGRFDDQGFLHIVGRKKDLIVTAAGKNVAPAPLEDLLRAAPLISQAMVIGDARPYIAALITLDDEAVRDWREHHDLDELRDEVQHTVDEVNASVSRAESIRKFEILPRDFDLASEEITPTLKVRRGVILERYADTIERLYET